MVEQDATKLRRNIERCRRLAAGTTDLPLATRLRELADESEAELSRPGR